MKILAKDNQLSQDWIANHQMKKISETDLQQSADLLDSQKSLKYEFDRSIATQ